MAFSTLFANSTAQAQSYALFRPRYPPELFKAVLKYVGVDGKKGTLAVDVATGSGQALEGLADSFERVIGVDSSLEQIQEAAPLGNAEYRQGDAHALPVEDGSADLVTVAQALHWFDRPRFYQEAARKLKPEGVLAIWCYDAGYITPEGGPVDKVYHDMWRGVLGPYWAAPRVLVDNLYQDIEPRTPYFQHEEAHEFTLASATTKDDLAGYVSSFSAYATYKQQHPDLPDPIIAFRERLEQAYREQGAPDDLQIVRRIALLMAKGPITQQ